MAFTRRKKIILIVAGVTALGCLAALLIAASIFSKRIEPFLREQAVLYMQDRFQSDVQLGALRLKLPKMSPLRLWRTRGNGLLARVEGEGISMRRNGDRRPLFSIQRFHFQVDIGSLFDRKPIVSGIVLDDMTINVPPKGERRPLVPERKEESGGSGPKVHIEDVLIRNANLYILPRDEKKIPLQFAISRLKLQSVGTGTAMNYEAALTNPKPPGQINSKGSFGPWVAGEPGDTPLKGVYSFKDADLGVFAGIAGILQSTGEFEGSLASLIAKGTATVPDFRLEMSGNPVPLRTQFEVLVDGTNGNTVLQPVKATLGSTNFTTSGGIIKHEGDQRRTISLDVSMPKGQLRDILRLAMKGTPFMEGVLNLKTRIDIPPLTGKVRDKLVLDGRFEVTNGKFLRSKIQDKIDSLSRRGQGQPKNEEIDEVVSGMKGRFFMSDELLTFSSLTFGVPGADIKLAGNYDLDRDLIAFRGALRLKAKVSETMTGWKRWALKPVDPFLAKNGAGTFLRIKIEGTSKEPTFGLDRGGDDKEETRARTSANR